MIPPQEMCAWRTQICEGNFCLSNENTFVPHSTSIVPKFIELTYAQLTEEKNYNIEHEENVFCKAASQGPIAIIIDECMEDLGGNKPIAKFFHAFPSKLHDKFPKCTGYSLFIVLHNMCPRRDLAGNIATLKMQSKMHIISPQMHPSQINRFVNIYTKGLPTAICLLLKDIFNYHRNNTKFEWIVYSVNPITDSMQWLYYGKDGLMPMYLNVQTLLYNCLKKIDKVLKDRKRWNKYYHCKRNKLY
uniref:IVa2 n=1 Tax=Bat mastadenovirus TaxID=740971 RepID=A0A894JI40_9ADEN|nr:IVa2 [Bat mastadenovirus]